MCFGAHPLVDEQDLAAFGRSSMPLPELKIISKPDRAGLGGHLLHVICDFRMAGNDFGIWPILVEGGTPVLNIFVLAFPGLLPRTHHQGEGFVVSVEGTHSSVVLFGDTIVGLPIGSIEASIWEGGVPSLAELVDFFRYFSQVLSKGAEDDAEGAFLPLQENQQFEKGVDDSDVRAVSCPQASPQSFRVVTEGISRLTLHGETGLLLTPGLFVWYMSLQVLGVANEL
mmetsp:Transcript_59593/g.126225  ORF Transcript_59593/g.126225 Transcript_59593/m.126225 type:complete len:227 (+) Transcript_59593:463-1143(+)